MRDREKVIERIYDAIDYGVCVDLFMDILELMKEQDAKPLRCKECVYHRNDGWCNENRREVKESDYCSFGAWEGR